MDNSLHNPKQTQKYKWYMLLKETAQTAENGIYCLT